MRVGEELLALARGALEGVLQLVLGQRDAEALAAAAAGRLDGDREADRRPWRSSCASSTVSTGSVVPGTIGTPAACISSRALVLEPIASIALRGRADEDDARLVARAREGGVLGEEAVAGVDRLGAGLLATSMIFSTIEVALGRPGRGRAGRPRRRAGRAARRGRARSRRRRWRSPVSSQRAHDADRDLAAVGDQNLREHAARKAIFKCRRDGPAVSRAAAAGRSRAAARRRWSGPRGPARRGGRRRRCRRGRRWRRRPRAGRRPPERRRSCSAARAVSSTSKRVSETAEAAVARASGDLDLVVAGVLGDGERTEAPGDEPAVVLDGHGELVVGVVGVFAAGLRATGCGRSPAWSSCPRRGAGARSRR